MRQITGAAANSNIRKLDDETGRQSVWERSDEATVTMKFKIN